jgi:hypothetical protein
MRGHKGQADFKAMKKERGLKKPGKHRKIAGARGRRARY